MKILDAAKVWVSRDEVASFNACWPCSTLRTTRAYWFQFDPANGDLIDCDVPEHDDGPAATAMVDDCKAYYFTGEMPVWANK